MAGTHKRGEEIRRFILDNVEDHSGDIAKVVAEKFAISRQAVNKHLQRLAEHNLLTVQGNTRNRLYSLGQLVHWEHVYPLEHSLEEDAVWRSDIAPRLGRLPGNVREILQHGFTEMFNNAIDHSSGTAVKIILVQTASFTVLTLSDDGEGVFNKIQRELGLLDERHAVLELAKGKLTTDPKHHSGEGIFFTSRMFECFELHSGSVHFLHRFERMEDWIVESRGLVTGTIVSMTLKTKTNRTVQEIFDSFTSGEDHGFTKTVVPVSLAQYGDDTLVSRSQAKRLLARIDKFKTVVFDFSGVDTIGQAFADEVFRVFALQHPHIEIVPTNANRNVQQMISRALAHEKAN